MARSRLGHGLALQALAPVDLAGAGAVNGFSRENARRYLVLFVGDVWHLAFLKGVTGFVT